MSARRRGGRVRPEPPEKAMLRGGITGIALVAAATAALALVAAVVSLALLALM